MFKVSNKYNVDSNIPIIKNNYHIFHYDEFPILFSGTNLYGSRVIGSLCETNEKNGSNRFIHILIDERMYIKFIKGAISYLSLIKSCERVFLVDKDINDNQNIYNPPIKEIPEGFLPMPDIFCPNVETAIGHDFRVSLKGGIADAHEGIAETISTISMSIKNVFETILSNIGVEGQKSVVRQLPSSESSFGINFRIKHEFDSLYYDAITDDLINAFVTSYLSYSLNHLIKDVELFVQGKEASSFYKTLVVEPLKLIYDSLYAKYDSLTYEKLRKKTLEIPSKLDAIFELMDKGFEYIEIKTINHNDDDDPKANIGVIDKEFLISNSKVSELIDDSQESSTSDLNSREYEIQIYHLNKKTRKGNGYYNNLETPQKPRIDSPAFSIEGVLNLDNSKYTNSLDQGTFITVTAVAKRTSGRVRFLKIIE